MMPPGIWKNRLIAVANATSLTTGAVMIGVSTFLPAFVQGAMDQPPTVAGFTLTMMSIGSETDSPFLAQPTASGRALRFSGSRRVLTTSRWSGSLRDAALTAHPACRTSQRVGINCATSFSRQDKDHNQRYGAQPGKGIADSGIDSGRSLRVCPE